ncbi:MAG: ABC transporter ATP-binding protein [Dethiosulfovibrio peptidovorans]|nr:MAG: ABC transporter ATP-binding protein [Dethiosulfovibrio peptidovorans]
MYFEAKNLVLSYGHVQALKDVSLSVEKGEIVTLIGANGAGKTSVLRAITGLKKIKNGSISFDGNKLDNLSTEQVVSKGIAMVPEGRHVFPIMSVKDNLLMGAFCLKKDKVTIKNRLEMVFNRFPQLKDRSKQLAGTMSGGEQQMLVIGRALMADPKLLLLDEPSLGVAPIVVGEIVDVVKKINKEEGVSVILVEQNSRMALKISHRAYVMMNGEVVFQGNSDELYNDERIQKAYLGGDLKSASN